MKHGLLLFVPRSNHGNLMEGMKKTINKRENTKLSNPWWTVSLQWTWPYVCPRGGVLKRLAQMCNLQGKQTTGSAGRGFKLEPWILPLCPGIMNLHCFTEGIWGSTSEGPCQDHGAPKFGLDVAVQPRSWNHQHKVCCVCVLSQWVLFNSLQPHGCSPPGSSVQGETPGKNTRVGFHAILQGVFPTPGLNSGLPHRRQIL